MEKDLGLAVEYKTQDSVIGKWLKVFFGLSFLTPEEIDECFAFDIFCNTPDDNRTVAFADYIVRNYIDAAWMPILYSSVIWSQPNLDMKTTTNDCEAYRQFSEMFYHHHPNIYDFMDKLKLIQTYNNLKIRAAKRPLPLSTVEKDNDRNLSNHVWRTERNQLLTCRILLY